jgi:hypothetical protein
MEINKFYDIKGVIPTEDIVEGRMVVLTSHTHNYDFGSKTDLPGCKVPATAEEANAAMFIVTWAVDNRETPIYQPNPSFNYALRQGFDRPANTPFSTTVYVTHPGNQNGLTIPSGTPCLAFGEGTYTVPSGCYINNAAIVNPGTLLQVANTAEDSTDAGKLKVVSTWGNRVIGVVEHYNTSNGDLTFSITK